MLGSLASQDGPRPRQSIEIAMAGVLGDRVIYIPIEPRQNKPDPKATANEPIVCRTFATTRNIKDPGSYRAGRTRRKSARSTGFRGPVSRPQ